MTTPWTAIASRLRRNQRGSTIVEAAIIIPLLCLLTFGAIEYGIAFRDSAEVANSTRGGARIGSTLTDAYDVCPVDNPTCTKFADNIKAAVSDSLEDLTSATPTSLWIYRSGTDGNPVAGPNSCTIDCLAYTWDNTTHTWTGGTGDTWTRDERVADACNNNLPAVVARVTASSTSLTNLFGGTKTLTHKTAMRLEPIDPEECP